MWVGVKHGGGTPEFCPVCTQVDIMIYMSKVFQSVVLSQMTGLARECPHIWVCLTQRWVMRPSHPQKSPVQTARRFWDG